MWVICYVCSHSTILLAVILTDYHTCLLMPVRCCINLLLLQLAKNFIRSKHACSCASHKHIKNMHGSIIDIISQTSYCKFVKKWPKAFDKKIVNSLQASLDGREKLWPTCCQRHVNSRLHACTSVFTGLQ